MTRPLHNRLASAWRAADKAGRAAIEEGITAQGLWPLFSKRDGVLYARKTQEDQERITNSGGGAFRGTSDDRRFWSEILSPEIVAIAGAGIGFQREEHTGLIHLGEAA